MGKIYCFGMKGRSSVHYSINGLSISLKLVAFEGLPCFWSENEENFGEFLSDF